MRISAIIPYGDSRPWVAQAGLSLSAKENAHWTVSRLRVGMIAARIAGAVIMPVMLIQFGMLVSLPIILIVIADEVIGRWVFAMR